MENMTTLRLIEQLKFERDLAVSQLQSLGLQLGQKTDHVKEVIAKQEPKPPKIGWALVLHDVKQIDCRCPACGESVWKKQKHCDECGQRIDWSGVDEEV